MYVFMLGMVGSASTRMKSSYLVMPGATTTHPTTTGLRDVRMERKRLNVFGSVLSFIQELFVGDPIEQSNKNRFDFQ